MQQPVPAYGQGDEEDHVIGPIFDALALARWVHFAAMFLLFGSAVFWLSIAPAPLAPGTDGLPWALGRTIRLVRIAAPVALLSGIAWLAASIANMTGAFADVADRETLHAFFFETAFGPMAVVRLVLLAVLVAVAVLPMQARPRLAAIGLASATLLISQAWLGHAAEGGGTLYGGAMIIAYAAHVLAGAAWLGGLAPLLLAIVACRGGEAGVTILDLLSRYSAMAVVAVSVIVVSGVANIWFRVGSAFGVLLSTAYGHVLFAKLAVVAVMLILAAFNRFVMMPRLSRAPRRPPIALARSVAFECCLGIVVLGVAAVLGITAPPY